MNKPLLPAEPIEYHPNFFVAFAYLNEMGEISFCCTGKGETFERSLKQLRDHAGENKLTSFIARAEQYFKPLVDISMTHAQLGKAIQDIVAHRCGNSETAIDSILKEMGFKCKDSV